MIICESRNRAMFIFLKLEVPNIHHKNKPESDVTMTLKVQDAVLPEGSWKVYTTCVIPILKNIPGACVSLIRVAVPELSVAVGRVQVTVVPGLPDAAVLRTSPVQLRVGGITSMPECIGEKTDIIIYQIKSQTTFEVLISYCEGGNVTLHRHSLYFIQSPFFYKIMPSNVIYFYKIMACIKSDKQTYNIDSKGAGCTIARWIFKLPFIKSSNQKRYSMLSFCIVNVKKYFLTL